MFSLSAPLFAQYSPGTFDAEVFPSFSWRMTAPLFPERYYHTVDVLPDGSLLVTGGRQSAYVMASTKLFHPEANAGAGAWEEVSPLSMPRERHTSTYLPTGAVVVTGGILYSPLVSAEIYNPTTRSWLSLPDMQDDRFEHTATPLGGLRILVIGSKEVNRSGLKTCEILEPLDVFRKDQAQTAALWRWRYTGSLTFGRGKHRAVRLNDGRVLVSGGVTSNSPTATTEIWDPVTEQWSMAPSMHFRRDRHTLTLLPDGKVLAIGGDDGGMGDDGLRELRSCEVFDPQANGGQGEWTRIASMIQPRKDHTATLIADRYVLVTGAWRSGQGEYSCEILDLMENPLTWRFGPMMNSARCNHTATVLPDGRIFIIGGEIQGYQGATEISDVSDRTLRIADHSTAMPETLVLSASPNPSDQNIWLHLSLAKAASTQVQIIDVLGRHVRTLSEGWLDSGVYSIVWDRRDDQNKVCPPGLYLGVVTVEGRVWNTRLILR
ncbi:MAG: hypothetical protein JXA28_11890 [Bacteroidetes bacterium]|nr:hypothetical protein [Bacteroidota bacterium]